MLAGKSTVRTLTLEELDGQTVLRQHERSTKEADGVSGEIAYIFKERKPLPGRYQLVRTLTLRVMQCVNLRKCGPDVKVEANTEKTDQLQNRKMVLSNSSFQTSSFHNSRSQELRPLLLACHLQSDPLATTLILGP